jgi:hypothetical protein
MQLPRGRRQGFAAGSNKPDLYGNKDTDTKRGSNLGFSDKSVTEAGSASKMKQIHEKEDSEEDDW